MDNKIDNSNNIQEEEKVEYICDGFSCRPVHTESTKEQFKNSSGLSMKINILQDDDCK